MNNPIVRFLILDEHGNIHGDFSCEGLAYEWMDTLEAEHQEVEYHIERRIVEDV